MIKPKLSMKDQDCVLHDCYNPKIFDTTELENILLKSPLKNGAHGLIVNV
jgi:hypothetical protein